MTQSPPDPPGTPATGPAADQFLDWQALPARARLLFLLANAPPLAFACALGGSLLAKLGAVLLDADGAGGLPMVLVGAALGLLIGGGLGGMLGHKQFRHTYWRLDPEGLALRRGRMWLRETRVPVTRVQHLDLKRGPLQRRRSLATLVVHTAGTRNSSVVVPNIDFDDAQFLRDRLGRQIDLDHDD